MIYGAARLVRVNYPWRSKATQHACAKPTAGVKLAFSLNSGCSVSSPARLGPLCATRGIAAVLADCGWRQSALLQAVLSSPAFSMQALTFPCPRLCSGRLGTRHRGRRARLLVRAQSGSPKLFKVVDPDSGRVDAVKNICSQEGFHTFLLAVVTCP